MSIESATQYANSIAQGIRERVEAGAPFGIIHDMEGWADVDGPEFADWRDNANTEWREATPIDYLEDVLDIQFIVNSDRTYRAARVLIAFGGPSAWINTQTGNVEAAWWSETVFAGLPGKFIDELDEALSELWGMGA